MGNAGGAWRGRPPGAFRGATILHPETVIGLPLFAELVLGFWCAALLDGRAPSRPVRTAGTPGYGVIARVL